MNRKDFFKLGVRWIILGCFGLLGIFLAIGRRIVVSEDCSVSHSCKSCNKFTQCLLSQANKKQKDEK